MPFLRSSTRPQAVECFFCLSPSILAPEVEAFDRKGKGREVAGTRWNWQCNKCACWNIRDERGEIKSDHPAMHDAMLNQRSFSLRARPSMSHLPAGPSISPFCQSCQANQVLIMNMLANYLPDENDPTYPSLYADLPRYISSLHSRYPPVCSACQPVVQAALKKSDQKAQAEAWGSALRRGAGMKDSQAHARERSSGEGGFLEKLVWRLRGALFCLGLGLSWMTGLWNLLHREMNDVYRIHGLRLTLALSLFHITSILWIAWDPYWLRRIKSQDRAKVQGQQTWIIDMLLTYIIRVSFSVYRFQSDGKQSQRWLQAAALTLDVLLFLHALTNLRITQPVSIQLVRPTSVDSSPHRPSHNHAAISPAHAPVAPLDALSFLSLSNNITYDLPPAHNPIFGQASLTPIPQYQVLESESMDWEPSPHAALSNGGWTRRPPAEWEEGKTSAAYGGRSDWDNFGIGKQRMFGRVGDGIEETGLESLLAGWGLGGTVDPPVRGNAEPHTLAAHTTSFMLDQGLLNRLMAGLALIRLGGSLILLLMRDVGDTERVIQQVMDNGHTALLCLEIATCCLNVSDTARKVLVERKLHWRPVGGALLGIVLRAVGFFEPGITRDLHCNDWIRIGRWAFWGISDGINVFSR